MNRQSAENENTYYNQHHHGNNEQQKYYNDKGHQYSYNEDDQRWSTTVQIGYNFRTENNDKGSNKDHFRQ